MMGIDLITDLQSIASQQTIQVEMGRFQKDIDAPSVLFPISIHRTSNGNYWK